MHSANQRPYAHQTSRYGSIGEAGEWREAIDAYYWDRMEQSYEIALNLGAGFGGAALDWYRMIEGEALTREAAKIEDVASKLTLEFDPADVSICDEHRNTIRQTCNTVGGRLGWDFDMDVRVTVLRQEIDAAWHGARFGYCIDKYPFDKICIPQRSAVRPSDLAEVVAHEFTHVITLNLTQDRIPHWLDEGVAMLMENSSPPLDKEWKGPIALNAAFEGDRREESGLTRATGAYAQSAHIVRHLHSIGGDENLAKLLRAFTNNSFWTEAKINLLGEPSVEEALHEVYGFGEHHLFEAARP